MKPVNMSVKDWLIRETAKEQGHEEQVCERVISWTYQKTARAAATNATVEMSGFGKLQLSKTKTERRILNTEKMVSRLLMQMERDVTPERKAYLEKSLATCLTKIEYLKKRLRDAKVEGYTERVEE